MSALETQVGGGHYKDMKIQPVEFIHANKIPYIEGCVIKYVCRHRSKNGKQDIEKAIHFLQLLIEQEYSDAPINEESKGRRKIHPYCCTKCGIGPLDAKQMMAHKCEPKVVAASTWDSECDVCHQKVRAGSEHHCKGPK